MTDEPDPTSGLILKDDGYPAAAEVHRFKAVTVHPPGAVPWVCLQLQVPASGSPGADPTSEAGAMDRAQFAMDPSGAHRLGLELIRLAAQAVEP